MIRQNERLVKKYHTAFEYYRLVLDMLQLWLRTGPDSKLALLMVLQPPNKVNEHDQTRWHHHQAEWLT